MMVSSCGLTGCTADRRLRTWRDFPKIFLPQIFGSVREKSAEKAVAPHYLAEPLSSAIKPGSESEAFFCHISWRQAHGSHNRAKRGKKATPRYVAGPFAPLCCVDSGFGGIHAILSGRTIFLSIEARLRVRGLFLPHIMAVGTWQPYQGKKGKKGHATLCGRTICAFVLC